MIYLEHLLRATGGEVAGPTFATEFDDFCYDSRLLHPGELFLAVKTPRGDGHDYIEEVARRGAAGVLCERPVDLRDHGVTVIRVPATQQALLDWASFILRHYDTEVVGITGSTGKTSTKEAIAKVLSTHFPVFRNYGNYNGRYGLPIALGRLHSSHRLAVLEMACDAFDEIQLLAEVTRPRVGIVTAVNHTHLAYLGSLENIAQEKSQLIRALPAGGTAILNYDDPRVRPMAEFTRAQAITFGLNPSADVAAEEIALGPDGTKMIIRIGRHRYPAQLRLLGRHSAYIASAAVAAGIAYDIAPEEAIDTLTDLLPLPGRLCPMTGVNGSRILDDTYNASPASTLAALDTLAELPAERHIAVLGHMADLGTFEEEGHRLVGQRAAEVVDHLIIKDEITHPIAHGAERRGFPPKEIFVSSTNEEIVRHLEEYLKAGDLALVKGSLEARLEGVVKGLMLDPEDADSQLVRQNRAWQEIRLVRPGRPTWVEVSLETIGANMRHIAEIVGPDVRVMAVLKADGYGHGAIRVARSVINNGASYLGVACVGEAVDLREAGIEIPILALGYTPAWQARELILANASATIFTLDVARALSHAAMELNRSVAVHVKVDTGMGRLGLLPHEVVPFVEDVRRLPGLNLEGIFTHFSIADAADKNYTRLQLETFRQALDDLAAHDISFPLVHAANSAAALTLPDSHFDMVRVGIALFGLAPSAETPLPEGIRPALSFKTQIAQVKELAPGSYVSYGNTYRTVGHQHIAVIPVGYADGFRRAPAHWGEVLVKGRRAPIVGRVCMDQTMIDVTDIPNVRQGDEVVLIGRQGHEEITVDEVARQLGTINYEVVSEILARVPRVS